MPPGDCEILRPFCCPADGAAMGAAAPGRGIWKGSKEGEAGRAAGRRGQGFGTPCVRGLRHSLHARPPRPCRDIRALRESLSPLSLRECRSPAPCALPPCLRGICPFRLLGNMPGRGCSHGCAWLAYLRSFRFLLANTRFSAICNNF